MKWHCTPFGCFFIANERRILMAVNEEIVTGRKFRKLIDEATKLWQRISFWTKASDVEFDDGSTAETKMGAINGITDSLVSTSSNVAASAKALSELNNNLMSRPEWIIDSTGQIIGYKTPGGADAVFPFRKLKSIPISIPKSKWTKVTLPEKAAIVIVIYGNTTSYQGAAVIDMVAKQTICNYMSVVSVGYLSETIVNCYFHHGTSGTLYYI